MLFLVMAAALAIWMDPLLEDRKLRETMSHDTDDLFLGEVALANVLITNVVHDGSCLRTSWESP
jgi:hypothetical protein